MFAIFESRLKMESDLQKTVNKLLNDKKTNYLDNASFKLKK